MAERRVGMNDLSAVIGEINAKLDIHIAVDAENGRKTAEMYKVLVTGNGEPSMKERMRGLESWVSGEKKLAWMFALAVVADIATRVYAAVYK